MAAPPSGDPRIGPLKGRHDRAAFTRGVESLDRYLKTRAGQNQRLGVVLLVDALRRAYASAETIGASMVVVDALDDAAARFYAAHGFIRLPDSPRLVLPMRSIAGLTTA